MILEESIRVRCTPERLWDVLTDIGAWPRWNTVIGTRQHRDEKRLVAGRVYQWTFRPWLFPLTLRARIDCFQPPRKLVWSGTKLGVEARHAFDLEARGDTTRLVSREAFCWPWPDIARRLFPDKRLRILTRRFLDELKGAAETGGWN